MMLNHRPDLEYLALCIRLLSEEADSVPAIAISWRSAVDAATQCLKAAQHEQNYRSWKNASDEADHLARILSEQAVAECCIARSYDCMSDLWQDFSAQEAGLSNHSIWDSYEHGTRRRLENALAELADVEGAVLVNTGMAALSAALLAAGCRRGVVLLAHSRLYYETEQLLGDWQDRFGFTLLRADLTNQTEFERVISANNPSIILGETVELLPKSRAFMVPTMLPPNAILVIDNSAASASHRWTADNARLPKERLLVVEGVSKYATEECMAGIVYGSSPLIKEARTASRSHGMALQQRAFLHLRLGLFRALEARLELHAMNAKAFLDSISADAPPELESTSLATAAESNHPDLPSGCLIFIALPSFSTPLAEQKLDAILKAWQASLASAGLTLAVRCGYGYRVTCARLYGGNALNRIDAPAYLRISIGLEPLASIFDFASAFRSAAFSVLHP